MRKIPTLFVRDRETGLVTDAVTAGCEWVTEGHGVPTIKLDGTCCLVRGGKLFRRHEVGKGKTPPPDFEAACDVDPVTGKQQGWVPVGDGPEDRWHREAFVTTATLSRGGVVPDGTYELLGPRVQGNPDRRAVHMLERRGAAIFKAPVPRDYSGLKAFLAANGIEGVVWHRGNGDMAELKGRDVGIDRRNGRGREPWEDVLDGQVAEQVSFYKGLVSPGAVIDAYAGVASPSPPTRYVAAESINRGDECWADRAGRLWNSEADAAWQGRGHVRVAPRFRQQPSADFMPEAELARVSAAVLDFARRHRHSGWFSRAVVGKDRDGVIGVELYTKGPREELWGADGFKEVAGFPVHATYEGVYAPIGGAAGPGGAGSDGGTDAP